MSSRSRFLSVQFFPFRGVTPETVAKAPRRPKEPATAPEGLPDRRRGAAPARRREAAPARGGAAVAGVAPPMRFTGAGGELAVILALDTELAGVDLTRDGLGDRGLDAAGEEMLGSHRERSSPDGQA